MEKMVRTRSQQRNGNPVVPVMEASPQLVSLSDNHSRINVSVSSKTPSKISQSSTSSRTVLKLTLEAEHARRLAELEKAVLEKEHQAKLAELDASGHGSRSSSRHSRGSRSIHSSVDKVNIWLESNNINSNHAPQIPLTTQPLSVNAGFPASASFVSPAIAEGPATTFTRGSPVPFVPVDPIGRKISQQHLKTHVKRFQTNQTNVDSVKA
ncbi:hypothetical protein ACJJTC_008870 [Scirpophaga incertulas]